MLKQLMNSPYVGKAVDKAVLQIEKLEKLEKT